MAKSELKTCPNCGNETWKKSKFSVKNGGSETFSVCASCGYVESDSKQVKKAADVE